jgi:hypothetical protein
VTIIDDVSDHVCARVRLQSLREALGPCFLDRLVHIVTLYVIKDQYLKVADQDLQLILPVTSLEVHRAFQTFSEAQLHHIAQITGLQVTRSPSHWDYFGY